MFGTRYMGTGSGFLNVSRAPPLERNRNLACAPSGRGMRHCFLPKSQCRTADLFGGIDAASSPFLHSCVRAHVPSEQTFSVGFVFGAVTVVSAYDKVSPSQEHELSETEQPEGMPRILLK